jgi:2-phosphoglycerate kinase
MGAESFQPVLLIAGGTGVGTSTLARALLPVARATSIIGTDAIREALREMQALGRLRRDDANPADALDHSTYRAWEPHANAAQRDYQRAATRARLARLDDHEITLPPDTSGTNDLIIASARHQIGAVMDAVFGVARRAIAEGFTIIIEGVHLDLERLQREDHWRVPTTEWDRYHRRLFPIFLDCKRERAHYERITERDSKHRHRTATKETYRQNWHAIRTICDDLRRHQEYAAVRADADAPLDDLVEQTALAYFAFKQVRGHERTTHIIDAPTPSSVRQQWLSAGLEDEINS